MNARVLFLIALILSGLNAIAQQYHSGLIYDVSGPVKKVKTSGGNEFSRWYGSESFTRDGQRKHDLMTYNDEMYPLGFRMALGSKVWEMTISYNDENLPSLITESSTMPGTRFNISIANTYKDGRMTSQVITTDKGTYTLEFSQWENDSYGNWTKRLVRQIYRKSPDDSPEESSYIQTRKINYYNPS